jgi:hypothetical protein
MDIDAVIAEATLAEAQPTAEVKTEAPKDAEVNTEVVEQVESDEAQPTEETEAKAEELFPKKAVNALSKRDKKIGKLSAEKQQLLSEKQQLLEKLAQYEAKQQQPSQQPVQKDGAPKMDDYQTFEEYNQAVVDFKLKQALELNAKQAKETQSTQELAKWADERSALVDKRITELAPIIPDFEAVLDEIEEELPPLSPEAARVALEADDVNLAAYVLHKEGKLMDVLKLPPSRMAAEIAKAEARGQQYLKPQIKTTNAPAPISAAKGTGSASKPIERMSNEELLAWVASK